MYINLRLGCKENLTKTLNWQEKKILNGIIAAGVPTKLKNKKSFQNNKFHVFFAPRDAFQWNWHSLRKNY